MNHYLQQIALRSGGVEGGHPSGFLPMEPVANHFGEDRLTSKESHEGWGEFFEPGKIGQATTPAPPKQTVVPATSPDQQLNPLAINAGMPPSYLKAQVQSRLSAPLDNPLQSPQLVAPNREPTSTERSPIEKEPVTIEQWQLRLIGQKEKAADLKKGLQPLPGVPLKKAHREPRVLQPDGAVPMPAMPKIKKVENKLVIGKITVEVVKPAVPIKERVVVRSNGPAPRTNYPERNKLSFGLGQL
jgi:hypothetical protein